VIVFEEIMNALEKLHSKEKSLRRKIYLDDAIKSLKKYDELR
jgi:hypothetical protein